MSQSTDRTNYDATPDVAAALAKSMAEAADVNREARGFVGSLRQTTSGYVQPGAYDVTDSLGPIPPADPPSARDLPDPPMPGMPAGASDPSTDMPMPAHIMPGMPKHMRGM